MQAIAIHPPSIFAHDARDAWLVVGLAVHAATIAAIVGGAPRGALALAAVIAIALLTVWTSNTVAHIHLHKPIFSSRPINRALALALTAVTFIPQTLWAQRHLWHHAGEPRGRVVRPNARMATETTLIALVWIALASRDLGFVLRVLLPGHVLGLALCQAQGALEHTRGLGGVSHYGRVYNALWFNDGHHAEHHRAPAAHWSELPELRHATGESTHPPLLRWLEPGIVRALLLGVLERVALASISIQAWLVRRHALALRALLRTLPETPRRVCIVGGGLFPRTVIVLRRILPSAELVVVDACPASVDCARRWMRARGQSMPKTIVASFDPKAHAGFDLVIFPLALVGDRTVSTRALATSRAVATHEWIWSGRGISRVVSLLLFKRLCLVQR